MLILARRHLLALISVIGLAVGVSITGRAQDVPATSSNKTPLYLSYEQRLVSSYLLAGAGASNEEHISLIRRMRQTLSQYMATPVKTISVSSFAEFLQAYQGPWPNSHALDVDLQLIENGMLEGPHRIETTNPELQLEIRKFYDSQLRQMSDLAKKTNFFEIPILASTFNGTSLNPLRLTWLAEMSVVNLENLMLRGFSTAADFIYKQMDQIKNIGKDIADSGKLKIGDPGLQLYLEKVFREYFERLSLESKRQIISLCMGSNLNSNVIEKFELMVSASGPIFQKLLQILARESNMSPDLLKIFKTLESSVRPVPPVLVQQLLDAERAQYNWVDYNLKALATGSMAQGHLGTINTPSGEKNVFIRFIKPGMAERVAEDSKIFLEIAPLLDGEPLLAQYGLPKLTPVVKDLNRTVTDELYLPATIERQEMGREVYTQTLRYRGDTDRKPIRIMIPKVLNYYPGSKLHVQELAQGEKLEKVASIYKETHPDFDRSIIEPLAEMWLEEVLFKSGFFHSDLHQGNFMIDFKESEISLGVLDFGMGGRLLPNMQKQIILLGAAAEVNDPVRLLESLWSLSESDENKISKAAFADSIKDRCKMIALQASGKQSGEKWFTWAMDQGIRFPYHFVNVNRGAVILDRALKNSGSELSISKVAQKVLKKYPKQVWNLLRQDGQYSLSEITHMGWIAFKRKVSVPTQPRTRVQIDPYSNLLLFPHSLAIRCEGVYH